MGRASPGERHCADCGVSATVKRLARLMVAAGSDGPAAETRCARRDGPSPFPQLCSTVQETRAGSSTARQARIYEYDLPKINFVSLDWTRAACALAVSSTEDVLAVLDDTKREAVVCCALHPVSFLLGGGVSPARHTEADRAGANDTPPACPRGMCYWPPGPRRGGKWRSVTKPRISVTVPTRVACLASPCTEGPGTCPAQTYFRDCLGVPGVSSSRFQGVGSPDLMSRQKLGKSFRASSLSSKKRAPFPGPSQ
jgi:hypothetical protein